MIIVTGGAGFIGSNLLAALEAAGEKKIVVCDRFGQSHKWLDGSSGKWKNIAKRQLHDIVYPHELFSYLDAHAKEIKIIYHLGANSYTAETNEDDIIHTNIQFSTKLFDWCASHKVRMVYASSGSTFGDGREGFDDPFELDYLRQLRPLNAYGWSKHVFDLKVATAFATKLPHPPQCVGLKFFNVYGPNEYHKGTQKSVIANLFPQISNGSKVRLFKSHNPNYKDGEQARDFIFVKDCVDVMVWLKDNPGVNGIFNLGSGRARTFNDLVNAIFMATGKRVAVEYIDTPESLRRHYQYFTEAKISRIQAAGYKQPFTSLEDGIKDYVQNYLMKEDAYV